MLLVGLYDKLIDSSVKVKNKNFKEIKSKTFKCIEKTYNSCKKI